MSNVLLVSINSIDELTGGGLYLRTICHRLNKNNEVSLVCKGKENELDSIGIFRCKKTIVSDLLSRLFLCPTFLFFYIFSIFRMSKGCNEIHFHSSRCIPLAILFNVLSDKSVFIHFDNVEYKLSILNIKGVCDCPLRVYDAFLLFLYEKLFLRFLKAKVTFITYDDGFFLGVEDFEVWPIGLPKPLSLREISTPIPLKEFKVLFVGSFSHKPNVEAFHRVDEIANKLPQVQFIVAGRCADELKPVSGNLLLVSDLSNEELSSLYSDCHVVVSTVSSGGGMKTKVAEAMSYGLPVIASRHSLIGYELVLGTDFVIEADSSSDYVESIMKLFNVYQTDEVLRLSSSQRDLFDLYYSV